MSDVLIGLDFTDVRTTAQGAAFRPGARGCAVDQVDGSIIKEYVYVSSAVLQAAGNVNQINSAAAAAAATLTLSAPGAANVGMRIGVAVAAIPAGGFGWMQIYGVCTVSTLASAIMQTQLNTTATAGALDDDATASSEVIDGLRLSATTGGAPAVTAAFANYPNLGRTL